MVKRKQYSLIVIRKYSSSSKYCGGFNLYYNYLAHCREDGIELIELMPDNLFPLLVIPFISDSCDFSYAIEHMKFYPWWFNITVNFSTEAPVYMLRKAFNDIYICAITRITRLAQVIDIYNYRNVFKRYILNNLNKNTNTRILGQLIKYINDEELKSKLIKKVLKTVL